MVTEYFVSEFYDHGRCDGSKGCMFGKEADAIQVRPKGEPIEKFWPDARTFSHNRAEFVAPLSSADIARLSTAEKKILFYLSGVWMPGTETIGSNSLKNILFAYQTLQDNNVYWTLKSTADAQAAIKKSVLRSNIGTGVGNAIGTVILFPISLFWAKSSVQEATVKAETLPAMEVLKRFVQESAKR